MVASFLARALPTALALLVGALLPGPTAADDAVPLPSLPELVLDQNLVRLSYESARLSALAYGDADLYLVASNGTAYSHPAYEEINFYTREPDQAVVARGLDGRCYIAYRGTNVNWDDWKQNLNLNNRVIFRNNVTDASGGGEFCETRAGYGDFLATPEAAEGVIDVAGCTSRCADPADCLVLTGHSQGGALATITSILMEKYDPIVITFGQPPAVDAGCPYVPSSRFYRYVNTRIERDGDLGIDPVPFSPTIVSKSVHYGHMIMVGDDDTAVKYLAFDGDYDIFPGFGDKDVAAHTMGIEDSEQSYEGRLRALLLEQEGAGGGLPVATGGFQDGTECDREYQELCAAGVCANDRACGLVVDLCSKGSCERDEDCASGSCVWDACAAGEGVVEPACPCGFDRDCAGGKCDKRFLSLDWTCAREDVPTGAVPDSSTQGEEEVKVRCSVTTSGFTEKGQLLDIRVIPSWSPRGASRFLDLVRMGYYDGCALSRVVPNFLTQFGISPDYTLRTEALSTTIEDDPVPETGAIKFRPGMMSFAGAGPNTRSAEVFIVMPGTPEGQLDLFGTNPWETPFGVIDNIEETPVPNFYSYGDFFPPGKGPHPQDIYPEGGYEYLAENFPLLDYIDYCIVVGDRSSIASPASTHRSGALAGLAAVAALAAL